MTWTTATPTVDGYYWLRTTGKLWNGDLCEVCQVVHFDTSYGVTFTGREPGIFCFEIAREMPDAEWCGPLQVPE